MYQRATAVVMAVYTVIFAVALIGMPVHDYEHWKALWSTASMRYATLLFILATLLHAWIGVRNVFMDYVHHAGVRFALYLASIVALVFYAAWSVRILWDL
jgi:succinate dehydrogenase / fumarate reductase membrane anchor subunit